MPEDERRTAGLYAMFEKELQDESGWWYLSFADDEGFLGVCWVKARGLIEATQIAYRLKINPGGEVLAIPLPNGIGEPPADSAYRLYSDKAEIERITSLWTAPS
jgi:hypothetical protein